MHTKYNIFDSCESLASSIFINIIDSYELNKKLTKEREELANFLKSFGKYKYNEGYNAALDACDDFQNLF